MKDVERLELNDVLVHLQQLDYYTVLSMVTNILVFYTADKAIDGYRLHKQYKPKNIKQVKLPLEVTQEYSNVDINELASKQFGDILCEFAKFMINKFSEKDLINFYNNINKLNIGSEKLGFQNFILKINSAATYDAKKNEIQIYDQNSSSVYHELFHMASSRYKDGVRYCGFKQVSLKIGVVSLGNGLNEGYTQLLSERYFGHIDGVKGAYFIEMGIAEKLEKVIGQEKMESLYLNSNLIGLIDELKQYATTEDIMNFITKIDFISNHIRDRKMSSLKKHFITNSLKDVNKFLITTYTNKLNTELDNGQINLCKFTDEIINYLLSLNVEYTVGKHQYLCLTAEDIIEIFKTNIKKEVYDTIVNSSESTPKSK